MVSCSPEAELWTNLLSVGLNVPSPLEKTRAARGVVEKSHPAEQGRGAQQQVQVGWVLVCLC